MAFLKGFVAGVLLLVVACLPLLILISAFLGHATEAYLYLGLEIACFVVAIYLLATSGSHE